jgi:hypothetical protein
VAAVTFVYHVNAAAGRITRDTGDTRITQTNLTTGCR